MNDLNQQLKIINQQFRRAFTLIELLIVVTIIILLVALMTPGLVRTMDTTKMTGCQSNMHQIQFAWNQFPLDHAGRIPYGCDGGSPSDSQEYIVTSGNTYANIGFGCLYPYIGTQSFSALNAMSAAQQELVLAAEPAVRAFKCPDDPFPSKRTYSAVDPMRGNFYSTSTTYGTDRLSGILNHGRQLVFVEEDDYRGTFNNGSWIMPSDDGSKWRWTDYTAPFHSNQTAQNYTFSDGHSELWAWKNAPVIAAGQLGFAMNGSGIVTANGPPPVGPFFLNQTGDAPVDRTDYARLRSCYRQISTVGTCRYFPDAASLGP